MKRLILVLLILAGSHAGFPQASVNVIPRPLSTKVSGGNYDLKQLKAIVCFSDSTALLARRLAEDLLRTADINIAVKQSDGSGESGSSISLIRDASLAAEAYNLVVNGSGISVRASSFGGFFNALQTLRQLMPAAIFGITCEKDVAWEIPQLVIDDVPAMQHRGFHLDVSRHFFDKQEVKKLLDMASVYKLNRFHWHLTDDQGWRIEIPEYPLLTTVGAIRKASLTVYDPTAGIRFFDDTEYGRGCYYTLDDLREVVDYARERNIEIIPEIDMPGHMTAALVAYPEFGCNPEKKIEVMTEGGISRDILNLGKDETLDFLKCVLGHVAEVFPYELIHLGGDECPTTAWTQNADCLRRIVKEGLSGVEELQPWLVETLGSFLREKYGKNVVVWDELLTNWNKKFTVKPVVMSWRGVEYSGRAADRGFQSIVVPTRPLYFDLLQMDVDKLEIDCPYMGGYGNGSVNTLENVYKFNPRSSVSGREEYVLGTQANLWTESCSSNREAEYQYYPRLLALSEIAWLPNSQKNYADFYRRLQHHQYILQAKEITYAPHYFETEELTPVERAVKETEDILSQTIPDAVGYPSSAEVNALREALEQLKADQKLSTFNARLSAFKSAPVTLPQAGKMYQIVSASTYFRNRFSGSSLYNHGTSLGIHYTQQADPEEIWLFQPQDDGRYQVVNFFTGNALSLSQSNNAKAKADKPQGSNFAVRKATLGAGGYTYIPGVVNIKSGNMCLYARISGSDLSIVASLDSALCYPGTWRIVEITDYRHWVERMVEKAERIVEDAQPKTVGQPTKEALQYLTTEVIAVGRKMMSQDEVSQQDYRNLADRYNQYLAMPTTTAIDLIESTCYYLIRNAYHTSYYATIGDDGLSVVPGELQEADGFRWQIVGKDDGTFRIYNKQTGTAAYVDTSTGEQRVMLGQNYAWTLSESTTEQGLSVIAILDQSGRRSWYISPNTSNYIQLKSSSWGASVWQFIETGEEVETGIEKMSNGETGKRRGDAGAVYDLSGRCILSSHPSLLKKGVYIRAGRKMVK